MQGSFSGRGPTRVARGAGAACILGFVVGIAGCGSPQSGGELSEDAGSPGSVAEASSRGEGKVGSQPQETQSQSEPKASSKTGWANSQQGPAVSEERTQAVREAIARDAEAMGLTAVHSVRVQSEEPKVSLALVVATRNGVRQALAMGVTKQANVWKVATVDTLPDGQHLQ